MPLKARMTKAEMAKTPHSARRQRFQTSLRAGSLGFCALALWTAPATADNSGRASRANACAQLGEGFRPIEGVDGCFRIGGHVRVETGIMRGAASLSRQPDGPAPAGFGGPFGGRLRAAPMPQAFPR